MRYQSAISLFLSILVVIPLAFSTQATPLPAAQGFPAARSDHAQTLPAYLPSLPDAPIPAGAAIPEQAAGPPAPADLAQAREALQSAPLMFIENVGQFDPAARFQVRGGSGALWLAENALWITVVEPGSEGAEERGPEQQSPRASAPQPRKGVNLRLSFVGADPSPRLEPFNPVETSVNYFLGDDPEEWRSNVPVWRGVHYVDLYPGVDLEITGEEGDWAWRLVNRQSSNSDVLSDVRLRVEGADNLLLDGDRLRLTTAIGDLMLPLLTVAGAPPASQPTTPAGRLAQTANPTPGTFEVSAPFHAPQPPDSSALHSSGPQDNPAALLYSTFVGGSDYEWGYALALDGAGNVLVAGRTPSSDYPTTAGAYDTGFNGNHDVFVFKLAAGGAGGLLYSTFVGGSTWDAGRALVLDGAGNAVVTGDTNSYDFPTTAGAYDTSQNGRDDAFVFKLAAGGDSLLYSTVVGGNTADVGYALVLDGAGNAVVTGYTNSYDFPTTAGAYDTGYNGIGDVFIFKLAVGGDSLLYSTFVGGSDYEWGYALALDGGGNVLVTGNTWSSDFPTTAGAYDTSHNGGYHDAFVFKLAASGTGGLLYSTFVGGSSGDWGEALALDRAGNVLVTGMTESADFPTTAGAYDTSHNGGFQDVFVFKLAAGGDFLLYSTFVGGGDGDWGYALALDGWGNVLVTGWTQSSDFPTTAGAYDASHNGGGYDVFVFKLAAGGDSILYSTFVGGSSSDYGYALALDGAGNVLVTGRTLSSDFPTTAGAYDTGHNGSEDVFVFKLALGTGPPPCDPTRQPVLLVHGWGGPDVMADDEMGFAQLCQWMQADGYVESCNLFYATRVRAENSREMNRAAIKDSLRNAYVSLTNENSPSYNPDWRGHFDIIGHSYGGLNARFYLESSYYEDDQSYGQYGIHMDNLFTLGSPHGGARLPQEAYPGAIWIAKDHTLQPVNLYDFLSAAGLLSVSMDAYNLSNQQPDGVCYRLIGGDFLQQSDVPTEVRVPYSLFWASPGDIGVSLRSSLGLDNNALLRRLYPRVISVANSDMHGYFPKKTGVPIVGELDLSHLDSYVRPESTYQQLIAPFLGASIEQCQTTQAHARALIAAGTEAEDLAPAPILIATDVITGGQSAAGSVLVDWQGPTAFHVSWMGGDVDLSLRDPSGTSITPTSVLNDPNAGYGKALFGASGLAAYVLTDTLTGTWNYTVTAAGGPYPIALQLYLNPDSHLTVHASAPEWQPWGVPAVITASLFYSTTPVSGADVRARVSRPDGNEGDIPLHDDGLSPDNAAGDGIYSGVYTDTSEGGFYHVLVEADGTYASESYHRNAQAVLTVAYENAGLTGAYADGPSDDDGDGLYEYLEVAVGVDATQLGHFTLAARLEDGEGRLIDLANTTVYSATGAVTLTLRFDGRAIRASELDGPYTVTGVLLVDDASLIKLDEADNAWVTAAYEHRQFGVWASQLYLPVIVRNR